MLKWGPALPSSAMLAHIYSGPRSTSSRALRKLTARSQDPPDEQSSIHPEIKETGVQVADHLAKTSKEVNLYT